MCRPSHTGDGLPGGVRGLRASGRGRWGAEGRRRLWCAGVSFRGFLSGPRRHTLANRWRPRARDAFGQEDSANVFCLLPYPPEAIQAAIDAYAKYFNDYSGKGLVADIHQTITDPDVLPLVKAMLAYTGIEESAEVKIIQRLELDNQVQGDA